ncbi:hypothetical protein BsWGS_03612 [Bradybaena similaris]
MNSFVVSALCVAGLALYVAFGDNEPCLNAPDGKTVSINCTSFTNCQRNRSVVVTCETGTVVERDSLTCKTIGTGKTACGTTGNCTGEGIQAAPGCQSFYSCVNGTFANNTHIYCPIDLRFDGVVCNHATNVSPYCKPI